MPGRTYPDEPAGPFPEPPLSFEDAEGRRIEVREFRGGDDGTAPGGDDAAGSAADEADVGEGDIGEAAAGESAAGESAADEAAADEAAADEVAADEAAADEAAAGVEALVEMYGEFDPADRAQGIPPTGEDRVRRWLDSILPGSVNAVACHDGRVVGHATLVPDEEGGYELAIFVGSDYQGAGIGTELLRALLGLGRARGVERVWLSVERWNTPAVSLYRSVGFETCGAESFELEMSLRL